jgi:putative ABC transport system permease protein
VPEIRHFISRLIALFRTGKADSDLTREINAHLQLLEDQFVEKGMTPEDARYAAKRAFGGVEQVKEHQREARTFVWLSGFAIDLKLGLRIMKKMPGLTIIAILALAVGMAAGATYFEFVTHLFRPTLSFAGADRLVGLLNWNPSKSNVEDRSLYEFLAWKSQLTTVEELGAGSQVEEIVATDRGLAESARGWEISASAFRVIPTSPLYGRTLIDDDEKPAAEPVVVIGEDFWKDLFESDPLIVGRQIRIGETVRIIVGVMPNGFGFPLSSAFWIPMQIDVAKVRRGEGPTIRMFGRLASGADMKQAQAELEKISAQMDKGRAEAPPIHASIHPYVDSFWVDFWRSPSTRSLFMIVYSVNIPFIALLGICAANVAQLVFARTMARKGEITVRRALGASRARIVGQFVAEGLVLASIAAVVGLSSVPFALQQVRKATLGRDMPFWWSEQLDLETIVYGGLLVIIAALVIGGLPALRATGPEMNTHLKEAGSGGTTMRLGKLWTGVIVTQVAVTVLLLLGLVSSGWIVYQRNAGAARIALPRNEYFVGSANLEEGATAERHVAVRHEFERRLKEDPDVINVTFAIDLPGDVGQDKSSLELPSTSGGLSGTLNVREAVPIGLNYFETFQQPLVAGRVFTAEEVEKRRPVVIVDETFVRLVLGGRRATGQLVREPQANQNPPGPWLEIVGVVKDIVPAPDKTTGDAMIYRPAGPNGNWWRMVVRSRRTSLARLRSVAAATDPQIRIGSMMTIEREFERDRDTVGRLLTALWIIPITTLILASAGIHSLISFTLSTRTREIGIRTALGATSFRIIRSVLLPSFIKVLTGIVVGSVPAVILMVNWLDWAITPGMIIGIAVSVAFFVIAIAALSSVWPIWRALKIPPSEALRMT